MPLGELFLTYPTESTEHVSQQVAECLARMSSRSVELLHLKYVDKLQIKDMAQRLGKSGKAMESELFRARNEFRAAYAEVEIEIETTV